MGAQKVKRACELRDERRNARWLGKSLHPDGDYFTARAGPAMVQCWRSYNSDRWAAQLFLVSAPHSGRLFLQRIKRKKLQDALDTLHSKLKDYHAKLHETLWDAT